jgi:hypothetical protein
VRVRGGGIKRSTLEVAVDARFTWADIYIVAARPDKPKRPRRPMSKESARWVSSSDVIPMFPTLVWKVELEAQLHKEIDAQVSAVLARLREPLAPLAPGHGWQSIQTLHALEEFRDLVSCVRRVVAGILRFLKVGYDAFEISACWAVLATGAAPCASGY